MFLFAAVWSSHVLSIKLKDPDPQCIVIDEVCGMFVSFLFIPMGWESVIAGFLLFRFFDVFKPPPIRLLERVPHGFGIVLDDVAAGIYANLVLQGLVRYVHL